jgi:hypothetical protein
VPGNLLLVFRRALRPAQRPNPFRHEERPLGIGHFPFAVNPKLLAEYLLPVLKELSG